MQTSTEQDEPFLLHPTDIIDIGPSSSIQKFYLLNITQSLKHGLKFPMIEHPQKFTVNFQLVGDTSSQNDTTTQDEEYFLQLFDLQVERPFIIFSYRDSTPPRHDNDEMYVCKLKTVFQIPMQELLIFLIFQ